MEKDQLKKLNKKQLRELITDLDIKLKTANDKLSIQPMQLETSSEDTESLKSQIKLLEDNNRRLQDELALAQPNKEISVILQEFRNSFKNIFKKKNRKHN